MNRHFGIILNIVRRNLLSMLRTLQAAAAFDCIDSILWVFLLLLHIVLKIFSSDFDNNKKKTNNKFYASLKVSMSVCVLQLNSFTFASLVGFFPTPSPLSPDAVCAFCSSNGMLGFSMTSFCVGFRNYITSRI